MDGFVKSADRTIDLLELLAKSSGSMSHIAIATSLDIPKSSLTQLIKNLLSRGYLEASADGRFYTLGPALASLAGYAARQRDLQAVSEPVLEELTRKTGESSALNVLEGDTIRLVSAVTSPQRLVSHMRKGDVAPLYATSAGKVMLAFMDRKRLENYFAAVEISRITPNTITSVTKLRAQLQTVREQRLADVFEEYTPGIVGLAVPIFGSGEIPLGALNVAIPTVRYGAQAREKIVQHLRAAVEAIERQLLPNRKSSSGRAA